MNRAVRRNSPILTTYFTAEEKWSSFYNSTKNVVEIKICDARIREILKWVENVLEETQSGALNGHIFQLFYSNNHKFSIIIVHQLI